MDPPATTNINYDTSWTIAAGSLEDSITLESSLSLINNDESITTTTVDSPAPKSPLILCPTSLDHSSPCEITITFPQKQELRQVYVRSSARVYEIYCASEFNSGNEYLCTVRCGIAARDEEVLRAVVDIEETPSAHQKGNVEELAEERLENSSNVTTSEDEWVEVKVVDSSLAVGESSSFESKSDTIQRRGSRSQDLYEATAEISDVDPCKSITLRLLSLHYKHCVCIDEVYVFADSVDEADVDNKAGPTEFSVGSPLMAMLMPTFLQLSRTKGLSPAQDKQNINRINGHKSEEIEPKPSDPIDAGNGSPLKKDAVQLEGKSGSSFQQEVQSQEEGTPITKPGLLEIPPQVSDIESKPGVLHDRIEGVLNQLVSRVSKIEDFCSRFEESMLKPIKSIDERLQRVEQQLEVLTKRTQYSGSLSCTRITAPEFSCSESETNSLYNSGCMDLSYASCETNRKDSFPAASSIHYDAIPVIDSMKKANPSLVVTAPEFSNCDNDGKGDAVEPAKEYPKESQKHAKSVDDALASALADFVSSTSIQSPRYLKVLAVKAPDFPNEDRNSNGDTASPTDLCRRCTEPSPCCSEPQGMEPLRSSISFLSSIASLENYDKMTRSPNIENRVKTGEEVDEQLQHNEGDEVNPRRIYVNFAIPSMHDVASTYDVTAGSNNGEVADGISNTKAVEKTENLEHLSGHKTNDGACTATEVTDLNKLNTCAEVAEEGSHQDILPNTKAVQNTENLEQLSDYQTDDGGRTTRQVTVLNKLDTYEEVAEDESHQNILPNAEAVERTDYLERLSGFQTDDGASTTREVTVSNKRNTCTEVAEDELHQSVLPKVVELSHSSAKLDFETSLLEVKFTSQVNLNASSPLEALLEGIPGSYAEEEAHSTPGRASKDDSHTEYQSSNLIVVDDLGMASSGTDDLISVDTDYCNLPRLPLIAEGATHLKNE